MMLDVSGLAKKFAGVTAVSDVGFGVAEGEIVSLIGPNGAGKTSVFNMITGFYSADRGSIRFGGRELRGMVPHQIARIGVARTFQNLELFRDMTVEGNMQVACQCHSPVTLAGAIFRSPTARRRERQDSARIVTLIEAVGLRDRMDEPASQLSYGAQRRLEIARALATGACLLLLDEPTAGMTPAEVEDILDLARKVRESGVTILLIEHNMHLVMRVSDRIVVMDHGIKIADGKPEEIQGDAHVRQAYLGDAG
ncbi:MAG: ABC transporter ATP-binding protein [Caldimonas sp.]